MNNSSLCAHPCLRIFGLLKIYFILWWILKTYLKCEIKHDSFSYNIVDYKESRLNRERARVEK